MNSRTDLKLGDLVKDKVTGFTGIAIGVHSYLNGCLRISIQPREMKDAKPIDPMIFDVEQLELVESGVMSEKPVEARTGGPMPDPGVRRV